MRSASGPGKVVLGVLLIWLARLLVGRLGFSLASVFTASYSANIFFNERAAPTAFLLEQLAELAKVVGSGYFLLSYALVLPGFLLLSRLNLCPTSRAVRCLQSWTRKRMSKLWVAALMFLLILAVHRWVLLDYSLSSDEFVYLFQAKILATFHLAIPTPRSPDSFQILGLVDDGRHVYAKYSLGWPMVLSLGELIGSTAWVNPLISVGCLYLLYRLGQDLFDTATATWGVFLLGVSPYFLCNAASEVVHPSALFFLLLALNAYRAALRSARIEPLLLAQVAVVLLVQTRAVEALGLSVLLIGCTGAEQLRRREPWMTAGAFVLGALLLLGLNRAQTGATLPLAFTLADPSDYWGLGAHGHNLMRAFWNGTYSLARWLFWMPVFFMELALLGLRKPDRGAYTLAGAIALQLLFYSCYYNIGLVEFGPRYAFVPIALASLLAGRALARQQAGRNWALPFVVYAVCQNGALFSSVHAEYLPQAFLSESVQNYLVAQAPETLLFVRSTDKGTGGEYIRNDPFLGGPVVRALYLSEEANRRVIEQFPRRKAFVLDYVTGRGFGMHPFSQDRYGAVEAGQNYLLDLRQEELARQCFLRAVQLDPDNARAWTYLGNIAYARNKPSQALAAWRHALRLQPGRTKVHAAIAHTLLEQGDKNGARQEWQQIVKLAPDSADGRRAADALASTK